MRFILVLALQALSASTFTAAAFRPIPVPGFEQHPLFDPDDSGSVPFLGASDDSVVVPDARPFSDEHASIFSAISNDERFTRLTKAIKFVDGVEDILDNEDAQLTFFAPPDEALRRPDKNRTHWSAWNSLEGLSEDTVDLPSALELLEDLDFMAFEGNKHDKDRCKRVLQVIIKALLGYHIVPTGAYSVHALGKNQTFSTNLTIPGTLDYNAQRLRIQSKVIPPATFVNFYSRVTYENWKASNGLIHVIDHPLIPPPSAFEGLYMFPHFFSTFTSALQRSNLTNAVDLRYVHHEGWKGSSSITVFAPSNQAFDRLPHKLQLYLFSPFGARALKKLLQYHVAPDALLFSDFVHFGEDEGIASACACASSHVDGMEAASSSIGRFFWGTRFGSVKGALNSRDVVTNLTYDVDTLFSKHTVHTQILKNKISYPFPGPKKPSRYETKLFVNHHQVFLADVPARNGVVHVVRRLLNPCFDHHKHHHHPPHGPLPVLHDGQDTDCWEDWERWLPQWAALD